MKRYWSISVLSLSVMVIGGIVIRNVSVQANDSYNTQYRPTSNPTEYILKLTSFPQRQLSKIPEKKLYASTSGVLEEKLKDKKLQLCQSLSQNVVKRSLNLVKLVSEIKNKFTSIITGVENYYKEKILPTGVSLSNYDALTADITVREKAVTTLLSTAQTDAANFSCTANNPSAQLKQFATDMQLVMKALKEYRTGIHNLIVAVKGLAPTTAPSPTTSITSTP